MHSLSWAYQTYLRHDRKEQNHWQDVCQAFRQYAIFAMTQWANSQYRLHSLPETQRAHLPPALRIDTPDFEERSKLYKEAAIRNQFCLDCILRHSGEQHSQEAVSDGTYASDEHISKVTSVLKSLARDWSIEGKAERDTTYPHILKLVEKYIPKTSEDGTRCRVCVPGAGVGRLACEIRAQGYSVQGNEFSLFMLLASDFVLNGAVGSRENPLRISPYLLESRNTHSFEDMCRTVSIPDMDPFEMVQSSHPGTDFSMAAGDFASIYSQDKMAWDGIVACFFLDTSPSIVEYLQVAYDMLKPGGVLIHFGPLLWHWSGPAMRPNDGAPDEYRRRFSHLDPNYLSSVDLSWEDVRSVVVSIGFEIVEEMSGVEALYTADPRSMMNTTYKCVGLVAKKPESPTEKDIGKSTPLEHRQSL